MTTIASTVRTARKRHHCDDCGARHIVLGSRYVDARIASDGRVSTVRSHPLCAEVAYEMWNDSGLGYDEWPDPGEVAGAVGDLLVAAIRRVVR